MHLNQVLTTPYLIRDTQNLNYIHLAVNKIINKLVKPKPK